MSRRIVFFLSALGLIIVGLVSYRLYKDNEGKKAEANAGRTRGGATVYAQVVEGKTFSDFLSLTGTIEPNEIVDLRSEISGIVESIHFSEGSAVSSGQVLLRINDAELRAQLSQVQTRNALASENERRAKLLLEKEAISQEEYDMTNAEYKSTQSQIQLLEAQLSKTVLKAPFSGTIGLRKISKGSYITPTTEIAQVVNTNKLKISFSIPERYANKVKINNTVHFSFQGDTLQYVARVYATEPIVEATTRTLGVRAIVDNTDNKLVPGTFANIVFPLETIQQAILIPTEALIPVQNGKKVFVLNNGKAKEISVTSGARTEEAVLITKGLHVGDMVLTSGVMSLRDGSNVKVSLR